VWRRIFVTELNKVKNFRRDNRLCYSPMVLMKQFLHDGGKQVSMFMLFSIAYTVSGLARIISLQ